MDVEAVLALLTALGAQAVDKQHRHPLAHLDGGIAAVVFGQAVVLQLATVGSCSRAVICAKYVSLALICGVSRMSKPIVSVSSAATLIGIGCVKLTSNFSVPAFSSKTPTSTVVSLPP